MLRSEKDEMVNECEQAFPLSLFINDPTKTAPISM